MRRAASWLLVSGLVVLLCACGDGSGEGSAGPGGGGSGGSEHVTLRTPGGKVEVDSGIDVEELGVPVFPGAHLRDDDGSSLTRVSTGGAVSMSGCFRTSATLKEIVAFYEEQIEGATVVKTGDSAMIMADLGDGLTAQIICSVDSDTDEREIVITSTRTQ